MSEKTKAALALIFALGGANFVYADENHHENAIPEHHTTEEQSAGNTSKQMMMPGSSEMGGKHHEMMQNMMLQMHAGMAMKGSVGGMGIMDREMLGFMHTPMGKNIKPDANGDGEISSEESQNHMQSMRTIADKDGNGTVSLEEFETLHNMVMRNQMVDRFQHLDADGDGEITESEMTTQANRMKTHSSTKMKPSDAPISES
ncbi:EF-hand domain-containing protein [Parasedimentitalea huanghaiensis]|nr:calcium-binding protein [Zongyanglinia huanghaiensis]